MELEGQPPKKNSSEKLLARESRRLAFANLALVETARGSTYQYLPDGTTQRFKRAESRLEEPQSALVYVPDYSWFKKHAPPNLLERLGENETIYHETLLEYVQNPRKEENRKVYIVDEDGNRVETNLEIIGSDKPVYLVFLSRGSVDFRIPISHTPIVGFMTFDTRSYVDEENGQQMRERHLGNAVTKIVSKES